MEDEADELPYLYFGKVDARVFDIIDNGRVSVLTSSKFVDLIETLREGFHSEELVGHLRKVYPNGSVSLDRFCF